MITDIGMKPVELRGSVQEYIAQICGSIYVSGDTPPKRLAITAAEAQEGKTSLGLAIAGRLASMLSVRVAFVEGNLRSPSAAAMVGLASDHPGLADVLAGHSTTETAVATLGEGLPDVMPAGFIDDQSAIARSMSKQKLQGILGELDGKYDHVIVESSPMNLYPEAQIVCSLADYVLLVIRAGVTSREAAAQTVKRLGLAGARSPAVVLNRKRFHLPKFLYNRL